MNPRIMIDPTEAITCPECDSKFPFHEGITHQLMEHYESELANKIDEERKIFQKQFAKDTEKAAAKKYGAQVDDLKELLEDREAENKRTKKRLEEKSEKAVIKATKEAYDEANQLKEELGTMNSKLGEYRDTEIALRKQKKKLEDQSAEMDVQMQRKLDEMTVEVQSQATESFQLQAAEYQKKIEDAQKANDNLKRKLEQGSGQLQGEVLELELEETLDQAFPLDDVQPIKKGARGADVVQSVRLRNGSVCGTIVWETKRAQNWSNSWIPKLKQDMQATGGEIAVLVSTVFPSGVEEGFILYDGVWVVRPRLARSLSEALRTVLIESFRQKAVSTGKDEKIEALYDYVCSTQFAQKVLAIVEAYEEMHHDLNREKAAMEKIWRKREFQINRITSNVMGMCGEIQGISSSAIPQIENISSLELLGDEAAT
jgi:hypothetical protein